MAPSALPAPFGIESLHDWSPTRYAHSVQRITNATSLAPIHHGPYSRSNSVISGAHHHRKGAVAESAFVLLPKNQGVWSRAPWGRITFRIKPGNQLMYNYWSYSANGPNDVEIENRLIGDLHFSPSATPGAAWDYWVCTKLLDGLAGTPKLRAGFFKTLIDKSVPPYPREDGKAMPRLDEIPSIATFHEAGPAF
ncbi:hypothetical protein FRC12_002893 [Ceratobasidium sp. 428]|nr:hypothetical protein FRC12_002893 [Ceratobasidium sp. 428]